MINYPYYYQKSDFNRQTFHDESRGDKCYSLHINCSVHQFLLIVSELVLVFIKPQLHSLLKAAAA